MNEERDEFQVLAVLRETAKTLHTETDYMKPTRLLALCLLMAALVMGLEGCVVFRTAGKVAGTVVGTTLKTTGKVINGAAHALD